MPLDRIITDPIISTENATFTPSSSSPREHLPLPFEVGVPSERDPLVGPPRPKKPFYRARPLWLVPFALSASLTRGMTLASRVEVFTELSCRQLHVNYNHTSLPDVQGTIYPPVDADPSFTLLHLPSTPPMPSLKESQGDGVSEGDDPRVIPGKKCVSDPAVQAAAAKLQTYMTSTMGVLSALTTGWWGRFGERHGRTRVLAISTFGLLLTDLIFILVSTPHNLLATHSHKLLVLSPIAEGLTGGWSSFSGANTAYIADCTSPGSRATIFARFTGVLAVGLALGPVIGAWLIRNPISFLKIGWANHPLQSVNSVFWVAIFGSLVNLLLVLFVFPESLPASRRAMNRKGKNRAIDGGDVETSNKHKWIVSRVVNSFISPLAELLPTDVPVVRTTGSSNNVQTRKDWNLTFLALSFFIYILSSGLIQIKYLYAEHIYDWGAETLSYYISFTGAIRAFHLLIFLPFLLVTFKPVRAAVSSAVSAQPIANASKAKSKPTKGRLFSEIRFDLFIIRCSMLVEFFSHALVVISPLPSKETSTWWSELIFVGATSLGGVGSGVTPAIESMALSTLQGRKLAAYKDELARSQGGTNLAEEDTAPETGKLFGAIGVVHSVGQAILGPIVFAMIYSTTVASYPKAIFTTAAVLVIISIVLTMFIRPDVSLSMPKNKRKKARPAPASGPRIEERRGRSRVSKDLRGGSASSGTPRNDGSVSTGRSMVGTSGNV